jgi:exodeoxyribonuclease-3
MDKTIKILSWNVNGIRAVARKEALEPLINNENPDIICLQETKISKEDDFPKKYKEIGYNLFISHSKEKKGYSGVAILSKSKPLEVKEGFGIEKFDKEGRVLEAHYKNFILFCVYFPNGQSSDERLNYKMEFYAEFEKHIENLRSKGKNVIICGDVNTAHKEIDLARPKANENISGFLQIERDWITQFLKKGWIDTLREFDGSTGLYTWWALRAIGARDRNIGWRIDYFFISKNLKNELINAYILNKYMGSDHCPIGIDIKSIKE